MEGLVEYSIPIHGLGNGLHRFQFEIDESFFRHFSESPVEAGAVSVTLDFDKRPDMYVMEFEFEGSLKAECDRCLAEIDLPVSGRERLLVKFSYEAEAEEAEVIYISPEAQQLNVARYIYEFIVLALPLIKVYDCENDENRVCNEEMLDYLEGHDPQNDLTDDEVNPVWEELKKLSKGKQ